MSMTTVAKSTFLNGLVGKTSTGLVLSNCYIGLSSTAPNADGSGFTEPTAAEYARGIVGMESQSGTLLWVLLLPEVSQIIRFFTFQKLSRIGVHSHISVCLRPLLAECR